jgi:hypothetical protein
MFWVKKPHSSEVARAGMEQFLALDAAGLGLAEIFRAFGPLAQASWNARKTRDEEGDGGESEFALANDSSVAITVSEYWEVAEYMTSALEVSAVREGAFRIKLELHGEYEGDFTYIEAIAMDAEDIPQLVNFLLLVRMIGGELRCVDPDDEDEDGAL